jgi:hypothetical protein
MAVVEVPWDAANGRKPSFSGAESRSLRVASRRIPDRRASSYWAWGGAPVAAREGDRVTPAGYDDDVIIA